MRRTAERDLALEEMRIWSGPVIRAESVMSAELIPPQETEKTSVSPSSSRMERGSSASPVAAQTKKSIRVARK